MAILGTGVGEPKKFLAAKSEDRRLAAPRTAVHYQSSKIGYSTQACRTHMSITKLPSYFQMPERPLFNAPQIKYAKMLIDIRGTSTRGILAWRAMRQVLCDAGPPRRQQQHPAESEVCARFNECFLSLRMWLVHHTCLSTSQIY